MCSPLGEYLGTMDKLGPFAKRDFCNAARGEDERFIPHLVMFSVKVVPLLIDLILIVALVAAAFVAAVVVLVVVEFEQSSTLSFLYPPKLLLSYMYLPRLFGWPHLYLSHILLNFPFCLSITLICLDSLSLLMNSWHFWRVSLSSRLLHLL